MAPDVTDVISVLSPAERGRSRGRAQRAPATPSRAFWIARRGRSAAGRLARGRRRPRTSRVPYSLVVADALDRSRRVPRRRGAPDEPRGGDLHSSAVLASVGARRLTTTHDGLERSSSSRPSIEHARVLPRTPAPASTDSSMDVPSNASELHAADVDGDLVDDVVAVLAGDDGFDGHDDLVVVLRQPGRATGRAGGVRHVPRAARRAHHRGGRLTRCSSRRTRRTMTWPAVRDRSRSCSAIRHASSWRPWPSSSRVATARSRRRCWST
jgi:hypothetical protein